MSQPDRRPGTAVDNKRHRKATIARHNAVALACVTFRFRVARWDDIRQQVTVRARWERPTFSAAHQGERRPGEERLAVVKKTHLAEVDVVVVVLMLPRGRAVDVADVTVEEVAIHQPGL